MTYGRLVIMNLCLHLAHDNNARRVTRIGVTQSKQMRKPRCFFKAAAAAYNIWLMGRIALITTPLAIYIWQVYTCMCCIGICSSGAGVLAILMSSRSSIECATRDRPQHTPPIKKKMLLVLRFCAEACDFERRDDDFSVWRAAIRRIHTHIFFFI